MVPGHLRTLFWDTNLDKFDPAAFPDYTILRVLELGDDEAVAWMRALIYQIPANEVAALGEGR